jgi:16S rRNA (cytosine1402-N4)-methyltransferase
MNYHKPVLLNESLDSLEIRGNGVYVDMTYGGGGHSREILNRLGSDGKLIAFDQDLDSQSNIIDDERLIFFRQNNIFLMQTLEYLKIRKVDGILADLGVSSHQLDKKNRGFSFYHGYKLDMRMNQNQNLDAIQVINNYSESELSNLFYLNGDLKNSKKIAKKICKERENKKITMSNDLNYVLETFFSANNKNSFLARVYQSIRIEVNKELEFLKEILIQSKNLLSKNGIMSIITYHSAEDRLVKRFFKNGCFDQEPVKDDFGNFSNPFKQKFHFLKPKESELKFNTRSRSAKLRSAIKL